MPENANLVKEWKAYEIALGAVWIGGSTGENGVSFDIISADNAVNVSSTVYMSLTSDGSSTTFYYDGPNAPFGGLSISVGAGYSGFRVRVVFEDFKIYARSTYATIKTFWSAIKFYVDDVLFSTLGGGESESLGFGPHYIRPLSGLCKIGPAVTMTGDYEINVWGGCRFQTQDDEWHDLPIKMPTVFESSSTLLDVFTDPFNPTPFPAPYGLSLPDYIWAERTYGDLFKLSKRVDGDITLDASGVTLWLIPNLPRTVVRVFGEDFGAEVWRFGRVGATATSARAGNQLDPFHFGTSGITQSVYDEQAQFSTDNFEDWHNSTEFECYTFCQVGVHKQTIGGPFETLTFNFPDSVTGGSGDQYHDDPITRLFASSVYHFGWNTGYTPREDQKIDDEVIKQNDYWQRIRELPLGLQGKRNTVYGCPLFESGHQPWQDTYRGGNIDLNLSGIRWLGVHRFDTKVYDDIPESRELSFGLIDVDPEDGDLIDNGTDFTVTSSYFMADLVSYVHFPYLYWTLCDKISVKWNPSEVSNVKVYVKELEGGVWYQINPIANDTPFTLPTGLKEHTAGSWKIDNGFSVVTDEGEDLTPEGISAYAMSFSNESFELLAGRRAKKIKVTFDLLGSDATFEFPKIYLSTDDKMFSLETGQVGDILWKNSSHLRWGQQFYYLDGFLNPPVPLGLGVKNTVIDGLCFANHLFNGELPSTNVVSDLTTLYDTYEVNSVGAVDRLTISYVLPFRDDKKWELALVDTTREVPPLLCFPHRDRASLGDWQPTDDWTNKTWVFTRLPRTIVSSNSQANIPGKTTSELSFGQWRLSKYIADIDYDPKQIVVGGVSIADVQAWHGWLLLAGSPSAEGMIDCDPEDYLNPRGCLLTDGKLYDLPGMRLIESDVLWADWYNILGSDFIAFLKGGEFWIYSCYGLKQSSGVFSDMVQFRSVVDSFSKVIVHIFRDSSGMLYAHSEGKPLTRIESPPGTPILAANNGFDVHYNNSALVLSVLTPDTDLSLITEEDNPVTYYFSYDNGAQWGRK